MPRSHQRLQRKLYRIEKHILFHQEQINRLEKRRREIQQILGQHHPQSPQPKEKQDNPLPMASILNEFQENLYLLRNTLDKALEYIEAASLIIKLSSQNPQEISQQLLQIISQLPLTAGSLAAETGEKSAANLFSNNAISQLLTEILKAQKD